MTVPVSDLIFIRLLFQPEEIRDIHRHSHMLPDGRWLTALVRRKEDTRLDAERLVQQEAGWADEDRPRSLGAFKARDASVPAIFCRHFDEEPQIRLAGFGARPGEPGPHTPPR